MARKDTKVIIAKKFESAEKIKIVKAGVGSEEILTIHKNDNVKENYRIIFLNCNEYKIIYVDVNQKVYYNENSDNPPMPSKNGLHKFIVYKNKLYILCDILSGSLKEGKEYMRLSTELDMTAYNWKNGKKGEKIMNIDLKDPKSKTFLVDDNRIYKWFKLAGLEDN